MSRDMTTATAQRTLYPLTTIELRFLEKRGIKLLVRDDEQPPPVLVHGMRVMGAGGVKGTFLGASRAGTLLISWD